MKKLSPYWPFWLGLFAGGIYLGWALYVLVAGTPGELAVWRIFDSCVAGFMGAMYVILLIRTAKRRRQADEALWAAEEAQRDYEERTAEVEQARRHYMAALNSLMPRPRRDAPNVVPPGYPCSPDDELPSGWAPIEPIHPAIPWSIEWDSRTAPGNAVPQ